MKDYNDSPVKVKQSSDGDTFAILPLQSAIELKDELAKAGRKCNLRDDTVDEETEHTDATLEFGKVSSEEANAIQAQVDSIERRGAA